MKALLIISLINIAIVTYLMIGVIYARNKTYNINSFVYCSLAWVYVIFTVERLAKKVKSNYDNSPIKNLISFREYGRIVSNALDTTNEKASKKTIDKICDEIDREYINQVAQMN